MSFSDKIRIFFLNFISQKIDGYICTNEASKRGEKDINTMVIEKYNVAAIKFTIPFLDQETHWTECYFIPKQAQEDLFFLSKLVRNMPIVGIFKKRRLIGFKKNQYDLIELWSQQAFKEIKKELFIEDIQEDMELTKLEHQRAEEVAKKQAAKLAKKAAEKEAKRLEREKLKAEKEAEKKLEKEAKKLGISVAKLKKQKEAEAAESGSATETESSSKQAEI